MTARERATLERVLIDLRADAEWPPSRLRDCEQRLWHYVRTLEAFLDRDLKFLRNHNYRLTPRAAIALATPDTKES